MFKYLGLAALLVIGCNGKDTGDTASDADTDTDTDTDTDADTTLTFVAGTNASGVSLTITNGSGSYMFGMAQTGVDPGVAWNGEDCLAGTAGYKICHNASATGVDLDFVGTADEVVAGSTTLFNDTHKGTITWAVFEGSAAGTCWTWGDDPTWYTPDCENIN